MPQAKPSYTKEQVEVTVRQLFPGVPFVDILRDNNKFQALMDHLDLVGGKPPSSEGVVRPSFSKLAVTRAPSLGSEPEPAPAPEPEAMPQADPTRPRRVNVKGVGVVEFPSSMPPAEVKDYLDRTYGPATPRRQGSILGDLAGAVTEPLAALREGGLQGVADSAKNMARWALTTRNAPTPAAKKTAEGVMGLANVPFEIPARLTERALEQAPRLWGGDPRSTWTSFLGGMAGSVAGPVAGSRLARRLFGSPTPAAPGAPAPAAPAAPAAGVPPASPTRPIIRHGPGGTYVRQPAAAAKPRLRVNSQTGKVDVPGLADPKLRLELGRPLIPHESAVGGVTHGASRVLSPIFSRMEALGPEGFEASRLLRRVQLDTLGRVAKDVQPLVTQLGRLSALQKTQVFKHLHTGDMTALGDPKVADAVKAFQKVFGPEGTLPQQMTAAGMGMYTREAGKVTRVGEFQPRDRFFPLEYPGSFKARVAESADFRNKLAEQLVREGKAKDLVEARRTIKQFIEGRKMGRDRPSPGEFRREAEVPGFITDPAEAALLRGYRTSHRLSELQHLGQQDAKLVAAVKQLRGRGMTEQADELETLIDISLGGGRGIGGNMDRRLGRLARGARSVQAFTKLPLAVIPNMTQSVWTAFRTDAVSTLKALGQTIFRTKDALHTAKELGAYSDIAARQLMADYASSTGEKFLGQVLRPFNAVEKFNRTVASLAGKNWAIKIDKAIQLHTPAEAPKLYRELRRLGFADQEARTVMAAKARLTPDQQDRIAREIVDQTQFIPSRGGRSEFFSSEIGAVFGQFKTFSTNLGRMLYRTVIDEVRAGNVTPAVRLLIYMGVPMQLAGELVADLRASITGRARPSAQHEFVQRALENILSVGGVGIATDLLTQVTTGRGLVQFLAGPTADDVGKLVDRVVGVAGAGTPAERARQATELARFGVRRIPYVGPPLVSPPTASPFTGPSLLPPTMSGPGTPKPSYGLNDLLGLSDRTANAARLRDHKRRMQETRRWRGY